MTRSSSSSNASCAPTSTNRSTSRPSRSRSAPTGAPSNDESVRRSTPLRSASSNVFASNGLGTFRQPPTSHPPSTPCESAYSEERRQRKEMVSSVSSRRETSHDKKN